jgi:hypothetical protein
LSKKQKKKNKKKEKERKKKKDGMSLIQHGTYYDQYKSKTKERFDLEWEHLEVAFHIGDAVKIRQAAFK